MVEIPFISSIFRAGQGIVSSIIPAQYQGYVQPSVTPQQVVVSQAPPPAQASPIKQSSQVTQAELAAARPEYAARYAGSESLITRTSTGYDTRAADVARAQALRQQEIQALSPFGQARYELQKAGAQQRTYSEQIQAAHGNIPLQQSLLPGYQQATERVWQAGLTLEKMQTGQPLLLRAQPQMGGAPIPPQMEYYQPKTFTQSGTLRPSDVDLWALQNLGTLGIATPVVIGISDFLFGGRSMVSSTGERTPLPSTGGAALSNAMTAIGVPTVPQKAMEELNKQAAEGSITAQVEGIGLGAVKAIRTDPVAAFAVPLLVSAGAGVLFEGALAAGGYATAAAASSNLPVISLAGRAISTPIAADIGKIGLFAAGTYLVGTTAMDIAGQPTATARGEKLVPAASELVGFVAGASLVSFPQAYNPFKGRELIGGELALSPLERTGLAVRTYIGSLTSPAPEAFRDIQEIYKAGRFVEPSRVSEPAIKEMSAAGKYATEIRGALSDTPHSMYGSGVVRSQVADEIAAKANLRLGVDVDVLVESPSEFLASLPKGVAAVTDPHSFPAGYPQVGQAAIIPERSLAPGYTRSLLEKIFGEPIPESMKLPRPSEVVRAGIDYPGEITYEQIGAQFGRKTQATYRALQDPIGKGYRLEKDIYDFITLFQTQREVALAKVGGEAIHPITQAEVALRSRTGFFSRESEMMVKETGELIPSRYITRTFREVQIENLGKYEPQKAIDIHTHPASWDSWIDALTETIRTGKITHPRKILAGPSESDIIGYTAEGLKGALIITPEKTVKIGPGESGQWGGYQKGGYQWSLGEPAKVTPAQKQVIEEFAAADVRLSDFMTREVTYAPVKEEPGRLVTKTIQQIYEEYSGKLMTKGAGQININIVETGEPGILSTGVSAWSRASPAFMSTFDRPSGVSGGYPSDLSISSPLSPAFGPYQSIEPYSSPLYSSSPAVSSTYGPSMPPSISMPSYTPPPPSISMPVYTPPPSISMPSYTPPPPTSTSPVYTPPPTPTLPGFPGFGWPPSGGGGDMFRLRQKRKYTELFPIGLDISWLSGRPVRRKAPRTRGARKKR